MDRRILGAAAVLLVAASAFLLVPSGESYSVSSGGLVTYTGRPAPEYSETLINQENGWSLYKVVFESRGSKIYGLLSIPENTDDNAEESLMPARASFQVSAFILLGGVTVTKEGIHGRLGEGLNSLEFATLSLDMRGEGETGGRVPSMEEDYQTFRDGGEPVQHSMLRDVLAAFDLLSERDGIDSERVYVAGESMGGRFAAMSAGAEPRIAGALLISTSGYGFTSSPDRELNRFLSSVDPDTYIGKISPRPVAFIHSSKDPVVPYETGRALFERAGEPKEFFTVDIAEHSYIPEEMGELLEEAVEEW
jgi:dienelactone hydrolase